MGYKTYASVNVSNFNSDQNNNKHYICNMCGSITTLSDSVSYKGYNLVCNRCLWNMRNILGRYDVITDIQKVGEEEEKKANSLMLEDE